MLKSGLVVAALVFSAAGFACDDAVKADGGMDAFRNRAMAQLRAENLDALRESLRRSQAELASQTRERYLAAQPGSANGTSPARGAP